MGRIRILEPAVAEKIAAGEVITRPAAAVKELVENALDAGAATISVEVEEGGRRRLRVVDDGCGMTPEEARLSLARHATSKLTGEDDLLHIATLGFRGEALPSIAAVSKLELITRPPDAGVGFRLFSVGGDLKEASPWPAPVGTQVTAAELFFNLPARRQFLRSKDAEQAQVLETVRRLALGYPEVHFSLATPAKTLLTAPAAAGLPERVAALYGPDPAAGMLAFAFGHGPCAVSGLLSHPDFSLASSRFQVLLVNRRVVTDRVLAAVLKEVYQGLLPRGRHPAAVVWLSLPLDQVDVNVHPAKAMVRFRDQGRVYALLLSALREGLGGLSRSRPPGVSWQPEPLRAAEASPGLPWTAPPGPASGPAPGPLPVGSASGPAAGPAPAPWRFQDLPLLGQLQNTYILAQAPEGLILIDQHAAHERVLYEALKDGPGQARQALLFPRVVEVPPSQAGWVQEHLEELLQAGLELEPFGPGTFLLTAAPAALPQADLEAVVAEAVEALAPLKSHTRPQAVQEQARLYLACRGAVKAGALLTPEEMRALLKQLDALAVSSHCPHGRPLWRLIPYADIRQSFRRPKDQG
jgi:DNA mismatch repair protein MutL